MDTVTLLTVRDGQQNVPVDVPAKLFGVWAVHRPYCYMDGDKPVTDDKQWTICHVPTGLGTLLHTRLRATAWEAAKEMAETLPAYRTKEEVLEDANSVLTVLQKHGLRRYC